MGLIDERKAQFDSGAISLPSFRTTAYYSGSLPEWHGIARCRFIADPGHEAGGYWEVRPARSGLAYDEDERPLDGRLTGVREESLEPILVVDKWVSSCSLCGSYDMYSDDPRMTELRKRLIEGRRSECGYHGRFAFAASPYGEGLFDGRMEWEGLTILPNLVVVGRRW